MGSPARSLLPGSVCSRTFARCYSFEHNNVSELLRRFRCHKDLCFQIPCFRSISLKEKRVQRAAFVRLVVFIGKLVTADWSVKGDCRCLGCRSRSGTECVQPPGMKHFMRGFNEVSQICTRRKPRFIYSPAPVCLQILKSSLSEKIFTFLTSGFKASSGF